MYLQITDKSVRSVTLHTHYQHVNTLLKSLNYYLMLSFVRQRNNLLMKKHCPLSLYLYIFLYLQNGYYIQKFAFLQDINGNFIIEGKKQVSRVRTMSTL